MVAYNAAELRAVAYMAAGAALAVVMEEHPRYVMPAEKLTVAIEGLLDRLAVAKGPGTIEL